MIYVSVLFEHLQHILTIPWSFWSLHLHFTSYKQHETWNKITHKIIQCLEYSRANHFNCEKAFCFNLNFKKNIFYSVLWPLYTEHCSFHSNAETLLLTQSVQGKKLNTWFILLLVLLLLLLLLLSTWLLVWRRTLHLLKHSSSASFIAWLDQAAEFPPCRHPSLISQCSTGPDSAPWRLNGLKKIRSPIFCSVL